MGEVHCEPGERYLGTNETCGRLRSLPRPSAYGWVPLHRLQPGTPAGGKHTANRALGQDRRTEGACWLAIG
jgi:hypothetical protein